MGGEDLSAVVIAFVALLGLILLMRWIFKPSRPRGTRPLVDASDSAELRLLHVVVIGLSRTSARQAGAGLGVVCIRSSMSLRRNGCMDVRVFQADLDRSR